MTNLHRYALILFIAGLTCSCGFADDELERRASWQYPEIESVRTDINDWIGESDLSEEIRAGIEKEWGQANGIEGAKLLQQVMATLGSGQSEVAEILKFCESPDQAGLPTFDWLESENHTPFVRNNTRLYLGKWFTMNEMYNEAIDILAPLETKDVVDPASLLFYRSAAQYRLRDKEPGLATIDTLLENRDILPRRYATIADLMKADLDNLKPDSLDEIARLMESVRARLGLGRAGTRVRTEEDEIIKKLEKLIEEKEKQRQQQQQQMAQGGGGGNNQSQNPMQDSNHAEARGKGDVDLKKIAGNTDWGNLPPKEREEALQSLGKDFPSHYREVIEEYFRKLAREEIATAE